MGDQPFTSHKHRYCHSKILRTYLGNHFFRQTRLRDRSHNSPVTSRAYHRPRIDSKGAYSRPKAVKPLCLEGLAESLADGFLNAARGFTPSHGDSESTFGRHCERAFGNADWVPLKPTAIGVNLEYSFSDRSSETV